MKKTIILLAILILNVNTVQAANLANKLKGEILLQVEANGEAWYINPEDSQRYYMGRPKKYRV